jgi:hypothetical protein
LTLIGVPDEISYEDEEESDIQATIKIDTEYKQRKLDD